MPLNSLKHCICITSMKNIITVHYKHDKKTLKLSDLQTQNSKFEPWRSEAEHAISRSRRIPTKFNIYEWAGKKHFASSRLEGQSGACSNLRSPTFQADSFTTAPGPHAYREASRAQPRTRKSGGGGRVVVEHNACHASDRGYSGLFWHSFLFKCFFPLHS